MRTNLWRWVRRYGPAEVVGLATALIGASVAQALTGSQALMAVTAAWAENAGYYGTMFVREVREERNVWRTLRNLALEFGPAELLDSVLLRPLIMYGSLSLVADPRVGVVLGKLIADVTFYVPAIAAYELRRRFSSTP